MFISMIFGTHYSAKLSVVGSIAIGYTTIDLNIEKIMEYKHNNVWIVRRMNIFTPNAVDIWNNNTKSNIPK